MSIFQRPAISWLEIWLLSLVAIFLLIIGLLSHFVHNGAHNHHNVRSKSTVNAVIPITLKLENTPSLDEVLKHVEEEEMQRFVADHTFDLGHVRRSSNQQHDPSSIAATKDRNALKFQGTNPQHREDNGQLRSGFRPPLRPDLEDARVHDAVNSNAIHFKFNNSRGLFVLLEDTYVFFSKNARMMLPEGSLVAGEVCSDQTLLHVSFPIMGHFAFFRNDGSPRVAFLILDSDRAKFHMETTMMDKFANLGISMINRIPSPESPYCLNISGEPSGQWTDQFPIGNGYFGGFVGGTVKHEIVPISTSDFFVFNKESLQASNHGKPIPHESEKFQHETIPPSQIGKDKENKPSPGMPINRSPYMQHEELLKDHIQGSLGYFEYLLDLVNVFDSNDFSILHAHSAPGILHGRQYTKQPPSPLHHPKENVCHRNPLVRNRNILLCDAQQALWKRSQHNSSVQENENDNNVVGKHVLLQESRLHMHLGITSTNVVEVDPTSLDSHRASKLRLHQREWFVNEKFHVMVAVYRCMVLGYLQDHSNVGGESCLDWSVLVQRQSRPNHEDPSDSQALSFTTNWVKQRISNPYSSQDNRKDDVSAILLTAIIKSSSSKLSPMVAVCILFICFDQSPDTDFMTNTEENMVHCRGGTEGMLLVSIAKSEDIWGRDPQTFSIDNEDQLTNLCWRRLNDSISLGLHSLRDNQINTYLNRMLRVGIEIKSSSNLQLNDAEQMNRMFQYGRYLLLSSASENSVANLQGLWSEGPISAWNGDYHININMQMIYWTMLSTGLNEVVPGFFKFVRKASELGRTTATTVYGYKNEDVKSNELGWMMHGFTDSTLRGDLFADLQWAMCISCGAWLSTHLFDVIAYQTIDKNVLINSVIPILRGSLNFFKYHIWFSSDTNSCLAQVATVNGIRRFAHTGPTTSPENSMRINPLGVLSYLALTPAIDISVLRDVVNMFSLLVEWVGHDYLDIDEDRQLARFMKDIVYQLPNSGVPKLFEESGRVMEYPDECSTKRVMIPPDTLSNHFQVDEEFDLGHRHFSLLHWLYPATLLPRLGDKLRNAAEKTIHSKLAAGGGHTAWSSAWSASLWARLGKGQEALKSLNWVVQNYTATNMLTLHPPLQAIDGEACVTCYKERMCPMKKSSLVEMLRTETVSRGFGDICGDVFQLDGNMGIVAALVEMMVQSHMPGVIQLLPAIPDVWFDGEGLVKQIRLRGNSHISIYWKKGRIVFARLEFQSGHPWWRGVKMENERDGFYQMSLSTNSLAVLYSKTQLRVISEDHTAANACPISVSSSTWPQAFDSKLTDWWSITLEVLKEEFPCTVLFCDKEINDTDCEREYLQRFPSVIPN